MNTLQPYIAALAKRTGLPLEVSSGDTFSALLDDKRLLIQALENNSAILFYMEIGRPTVFRRNEVLAALMKGNLFLAETKGAALSYDDASQMVGLNLLLPLRHLDAEEFINAVDNVVAAAEAWGERLRQFNAEAEERVRQANEAATHGNAGAVEAVPGPMLRI